jgi:uncharacterized protein (DUF952 family)
MPRACSCSLCRNKRRISHGFNGFNGLKSAESVESVANSSFPRFVIGSEYEHVVSRRRGNKLLPIFHITTAEEASEAAKSGEYSPQAFGSEGFIHCSYAHQVCHVANRRFKGRTDLVLFEIDRAKLPHKVIDENLEDGAELFPHVYGRLPMSAVIQTHQFLCDEGGEFQLPGTAASRIK